jgi:multidrug efflux pump subunit AcrA (membrane-fusion protein)
MKRMILRMTEKASLDSKSMKMVQGKWTLRALAVSMVILLFSFVAILIFTPWWQTSVGYGGVIAFSPDERVQTVDAVVSGRLGEWFVKEGDYVEADDPIVEILDNDPNILTKLKEQHDAAARVLDTSKIAADTSRLNLERQEKAFEKGLSSRLDYEKARLEYAKYVQEEAKASEALSKVDVRLAQQASQLVRAPRSGQILRRAAGEGGVLVKPGYSLVTLAPKTSSRSVALYIDGNDLPLIHEGDTVRIQFEGWPAIQFSGWPSVAVGTFGGTVAVVDESDNGLGKFRILVTPMEGQEWPSHEYLRQGVKAQGWVLLNRVSLGFELWRQFNGFPPGLPGAPSKAVNKNSEYESESEYDSSSSSSNTKG